METQHKLGLRNTIISYTEISNLLDKGKAVDIALTLARLLLFTVTSSETYSVICMDQTVFGI